MCWSSGGDDSSAQLSAIEIDTINSCEMKGRHYQAMRGVEQNVVRRQKHPPLGPFASSILHK